MSVPLSVGGDETETVVIVQKGTVVDGSLLRGSGR